MPNSQSQTVPDYLILGSGLAGLSFAALMAKAGKQVKVLEAHEFAGGYGHTFVEGDKYHFNAQLHYVWNCGAGETVNMFLRKLGLADAVTFEQYDADGFDHMRIPGYELDIPFDKEKLVARLAKLFPEHANSIQKFIKEVWRTAAELKKLPESANISYVLSHALNNQRVIKYHKSTLQDVFNAYKLPLEAQTLLALQWPDFLLPPNKLSFFAWAALFTGYCRGAYYPTHHFEHVIDSLVKVIEENGGEIIYQQKVTDFILDNKRVVGVKTMHAIDRSKRQEYQGQDIICNFDPKRTASVIGMDKFSSTVRAKLDYDYSPSNFVAYCVVKGIDLSDYGFGRWNLFHSEQADLNKVFDDMYERADYSALSFGVTTPGFLTDDASDCPDGEQIIQFITVANYQYFHDLKIRDAGAYRKMKKEIFDAMINVIEQKYVPNFREYIVFKMTGSPTTNESFCGAPEGNSYGSNLTPGNFSAGRLDHRTSLKNFYFCNASSGAPSFTGTIRTGCVLYEKLSGDPVLGADLS
ncbi:phytoene desaturase family protein [Methyloprofundus sp.]|uniref:phytoene desaturase family protein n=1 Tax=Methyloprofundus sp. TaxID=2020875 RepID=UPI003D0D814E